MSKITLTVQDALAKKKIIETRISDLNIGRLAYVSVATELQDNIGGLKRSDYESKLQSNFDMVDSLISNLRAIKSAINASNAVTKITIAGKEYTCADAIARLRSLDTEKGFYVAIKNQIDKCQKEIETRNSRVLDPDNVSEYIGRILGSETKKTDSLYGEILERYKKDNLLYLVDPKHLSEKIESRITEVAEFEAQVHNALVASNITTTIEVELED